MTIQEKAFIAAAKKYAKANLPSGMVLYASDFAYFAVEFKDTGLALDSLFFEYLITRYETLSRNKKSNALLIFSLKLALQEFLNREAKTEREISKSIEAVRI